MLETLSVTTLIPGNKVEEEVLVGEREADGDPVRGGGRHRRHHRRRRLLRRVGGRDSL